MEQEIERKFLVKSMPDLTGLEPVRYERYIIFLQDGIEDRIQLKGQEYEWERKEKLGDLSSKKEKKSISREEFERLKAKAKQRIIRDSYKFSESPQITIKIYHEEYEGLVRAEVEFVSVEQAEKYTPEVWMGEELTSSPLGRDSSLVNLTKQEFEQLLRK